MLNVYCIHRWLDAHEKDVLICSICGAQWSKIKQSTPPEVLIGQVSLPDPAYFGTLQEK